MADDEAIDLGDRYDGRVICRFDHHANTSGDEVHEILARLRHVRPIVERILRRIPDRNVVQRRAQMSSTFALEPASATGAP
jgi:hypothetical protein